MAEKTSAAVKTSEPGSQGARREAPPPAVLGLAGSLLDLQSATGNRSVGRLLGGVLLQPKLRIGPAGDAYEREADRVAEAVLREGKVPASVSVAGGAGIQRMCQECEEERLQRSESTGKDLVQRQCHCQDEEDLVQPKADGGQSQSTPGFEARVEALKGSGRPLPANVRNFFEPRFGQDFGAVRVHTGTAAGEAAKAVHARAFTVGNDVVFGASQWSPETAAGRRIAGPTTGEVTASALRIRREPSTSSPVVGYYPRGSVITVLCQTTGTPVDGNPVWNRTDRGFVSDRYVRRTGSVPPSSC